MAIRSFLRLTLFDTFSITLDSCTVFFTPEKRGDEWRTLTWRWYGHSFVVSFALHSVCITRCQTCVNRHFSWAHFFMLLPVVGVRSSFIPSEGFTSHQTELVRWSTIFDLHIVILMVATKQMANPFLAGFNLVEINGRRQLPLMNGRRRKKGHFHRNCSWNYTEYDERSVAFVHHSPDDLRV